MPFYRSVLNDGGSGEDYSATYTATINGELQRGSCFGSYTDNTLFNSPIVIGNNIDQCIYTLRGCSNFGSDVYIKGNSYRAINAYGMFFQTSNSKRKNIHFNRVFDPIFYNNNNGYDLVFSRLTWQNMTNGYYNATFNIYCYNNYSG